MPSTEKTEYTLYGGAVKLLFSPSSTKYRYTVTDAGTDEANTPVRGVTSVLKDIIAKPDLMTWTMNMSHKYLFGSKFDEESKEYVHDWKESALKPGVTYSEEELHNLMMDGSRQWVQRSDKGKDVGTMVHDAVEAFLKGLEPVFPEAEDKETIENVKCAQKALRAFVKWWESLEQKRVISTEKPIYSRMMKYAGTYDLLAEINGKVYLLDIKTTNASKKAPLGIYAEYFMQLGGYSFAHREETGDEVDDVGIIRVGKDGRLAIATATDIGLTRDACERAFAFGVRLHDWISTATPYLSDAHFKSHLLPSESKVDDEDSIE